MKFASPRAVGILLFALWIPSTWPLLLKLQAVELFLFFQLKRWASCYFIFIYFISLLCYGCDSLSFIGYALHSQSRSSRLISLSRSAFSQLQTVLIGLWTWQSGIFSHASRVDDICQTRSCQCLECRLRDSKRIFPVAKASIWLSTSFDCGSACTRKAEFSVYALLTDLNFDSFGSEPVCMWMRSSLSVTIIHNCIHLIEKGS